MIELIIRTLALAARLATYTADPSVAITHAIAAELAAGPGSPAELLLAIAWVESRFDPSATSRVVGGARITGSYASRSPAGSGPRFCGVMQTQAGHEWASCLEARPLIAGYELGATEIRQWLRLAHGDVAAALRGHGCGMSGMRGECRRYDRRVLAIARRLGLDAVRPRS